LVVEASLIRNDTVFTSDDEKIGTVINIILEPSSRHTRASILVFPPEKNWLEAYLRKNWGKLTIDTIQRLFPSQVPSIVKDIKEKGAAEAERLWNEYAKDNIKKIQMELTKCYLIPSLAVDGSKCTKKEVFLRSSLESVEGKYAYIGDPPVNDFQHMAFFSTPSKARRDWENLLPVTLNLTPIQSSEVQDCEGNTGYLEDLQIDCEQNAVANFVVQTVGKGAGNYLVNAEDVELSMLTSKKAFNTCAKKPFT
jgi:sporulation protein YlmC with PRC-barrel domain